MIGQPKYMSLIESVTNVCVGFVVAVSTQIAVFPFFGIHIALHSNLVIALIFTAVSIARSYLLRRVFNLIHMKFYGVK